MPENDPEHEMILAEHFDTLEQQHEAASFGMWAFLATEVLFFGGLFLGYAVYRNAYPQAFDRGSRELDVVFGTVNTAILLTSSLTMAMAVRAAQLSKRVSLIVHLELTALLGTIFMVVKGFEYAEDFHKGLIPLTSHDYRLLDISTRNLFLCVYYFMTGLHALHVTIGIGVILWMAKRARRGEFSARYNTPVELTGLYWHFVDVVWIFLYPLLYLVDRST